MPIFYERQSKGWPWPITKPQTEYKPDRTDDLDKDVRAIFAKADAHVAKLSAIDEVERIDTLTWTPPIEIVSHPVGDFLKFDNIEWPIRFIESITVADPGSAPCIANALPIPYGPVVVSIDYNEGNGIVEVRPSSGASTHIRLSRHKVPYLHEALVTAWKSHSLPSNRLGEPFT